MARSKEAKAKAQRAYHARTKDVRRVKALEYYHNNKEACAERAKLYRARTRSEKRAKQKVIRRERKLRAIEYKGGICVDCHGTYHPAAFEFHHLDPKGKDMEPSVSTFLKWETCVKELDKCVLLCSNCHRVRHFLERENIGI